MKRHSYEIYAAPNKGRLNKPPERTSRTHGPLNNGIEPSMTCDTALFMRIAYCAITRVRGCCIWQVLRSLAQSHFPSLSLCEINNQSIRTPIPPIRSTIHEGQKLTTTNDSRLSRSSTKQSLHTFVPPPETSTSTQPRTCDGFSVRNLPTSSHPPIACVSYRPVIHYAAQGIACRQG